MAPATLVAGVITSPNISTKEETMGRNTHLLREIIEVLADQVFNKDTALRDLDRRFNTRLIIDAGNVDTIQKHAKKLRLRVEKEELPLVLDYIANRRMVGITIDHVEDAINEMWDDRFIEPER
jgi:hypothetical protein